MPLRKCILLFGLLVAAFAGVASQSQAEATGSDPRSVVERAFANLYGFSSIQKVEIRASLAAGRDLTRTAQVIRRGADAGLNRMLIRFLDPEELRGTALLLLEREDYAYDSFLYQPMFQKVRRVSIAQRHDKVFGTHLAFEDLEVKHAKHWELALLREELLGDRKAWVIDMTPKGRPSAYDKIVGWFDQSSPVILKMEFFRGGEHFKRLDVDTSRIEERGGYAVPMVMTLRSGDGSSTRVEVKEIEFLKAIPDKLFSLSTLQQGDARSDRNRRLSQ